MVAAARRRPQHYEQIPRRFAPRDDTASSRAGPWRETTAICRFVLGFAFLGRSRDRRDKPLRDDSAGGMVSAAPSLPRVGLWCSFKLRDLEPDRLAVRHSKHVQEGMPSMRSCVPRQWLGRHRCPLAGKARTDHAILGSRQASSKVFSQLFPFLQLHGFWASAFAHNAYG